MTWQADWLNLDVHSEFTPYLIDLYNAYVERRFYTNEPADIIDIDDIRFKDADAITYYEDHLSYPSFTTLSALFLMTISSDVFVRRILESAIGEISNDQNTGMRFIDQTKEATWKAAYVDPNTERMDEAAMLTIIGEPEILYVTTSAQNRGFTDPITVEYLENRKLVYENLLWVNCQQQNQGNFGGAELITPETRATPSQGGIPFTWAEAVTAWNGSSWVAGTSLPAQHYAGEGTTGFFNIRRTAAIYGSYAPEYWFAEASGNIQRVADYYHRVNQSTFNGSSFSTLDVYYNADDNPPVPTDQEGWRLTHTNPIAGGAATGQTEESSVSIGKINSVTVIQPPANDDIGYGFESGNPQRMVVEKFDVVDGFQYV